MIRSLLSLLVPLMPLAVRADELTDLVKGPDRRAAWDKLVAKGPVVLPSLLAAMDHADTPAANWLRTAFDRIVDLEKTGGKRIDPDSLLRFVQDSRHAGRARRLALEVIEELRPGTTARLVAGWLDDPEFRYEAIESIIKNADAAEQTGKTDLAVAEFRRGFAASRDLLQAKAIAVRLQKLNQPFSVARHLGFLMDWEVLGPFDGKDMQGFRIAYSPEKDPKATQAEGKGGAMIRWKALHVKEPSPATPGHVALVNLRDALGEQHDAVAYARTTIEVDQAGDYEMRGAGDDNLSVWVNGEKVFAYEEYRNGVRFDRHRFKVKLKGGANTILAKICQAPLDATNPEPNWEFFLRVVDATGRGERFKVIAPK